MTGYVLLNLAVFVVLYAGAHAVSVVGHWNWRWNAQSWRVRGLLSDDGRGVVVRTLQWGHILRDRGWGPLQMAAVFRDERCARRAVALLQLVGGGTDHRVAYDRVENGPRPGEYARRVQRHNQQVYYKMVKESLDWEGTW